MNTEIKTLKKEFETIKSTFLPKEKLEDMNNTLDDKTKDLMKEAYQYGWAHAIEEVEKEIQTLKSLNLKPECVEVFDNLVSGICDVLKSHANKTKNK